MIKTDVITYGIDEINYHDTETTKTQIILCRSLRKKNFHITRLQRKDFGKTTKWNTYTISREGVIYQHYDNKLYTDFIGIKKVDKQSISVVLENMGSLFETSDNAYINWLNEICEPKNTKMKMWLGYKYWEKFPLKQIKSTVSLCGDLCDEFDIPKQCIDFDYYHKDIIKYNGIVFKSNYLENSGDIHPLFNIKKFNESLNK